MGRPRKEPPVNEVNIWKDIPGYENMYQANDDGQIRSIRRGRPKIMRPRFDKKINAMMVYVDNGKGKKGPIQVSKLIMDAFVGEMPKGMCRIHKNGDILDNRPCNLKYDTFSAAGRKVGGTAKRRPVAKVKFTGEIIKVYRSITDAARESGMSSTSVRKRCQHKIYNNLDNKGCTYMYMDSLFELKGDGMEW